MTSKNHTLKLLALTSLGTLFATGALAQDPTYYYGGISVGQSHGKSDASGMAAYQTRGTVPPLTVTGITRDDTDNAYRVFLGYQFNRNIGLEASFFNLGKFNYHATTNTATTLDGQTKIQGGGVDLVGALPLSDNWSLLGRIGGQYAKTRNVFSNSGGAVFVNDRSPSARQFNYKVGAGLQYAFNPHFLMRGEAEQYRTRDGIGGNDRVQVFSLSLVFPFGAGAQQRTAMMPAAYTPVAYVAPAEPMTTATPMVEAAPAAPMAPVVAAAPMAPMAPLPAPRRVSFTAESLFGFDKSTIRPEGKTALDTFARDVAGTQFDVIVVEGHADRIGTEAYNQTLSLQRAEAVKAYLVSSGGMDSTKITARGVGEKQPTQAGDCKATLSRSELRTCLQPDRRVDVDVTGTR